MPFHIFLPFHIIKLVKFLPLDYHSNETSLAEIWLFWRLSSWSLTVRTDRVLLPSFSLLEYTVKPCFTDTRLIRTPRYYGQFALSLRKESPEIFSKFNPLNTDLFYGPLSVC